MFLGLKVSLDHIMGVEISTGVTRKSFIPYWPWKFHTNGVNIITGVIFSGFNQSDPAFYRIVHICGVISFTAVKILYYIHLQLLS